MTTLRPLLAALLIMLPAGGYSACPDAWVEYEGSCYYGSNSSFGWEGAKQICREMQPGADLTSINSAAENAFVNGQFGHLQPWIGLNDVQREGDWRWVNGEPVTFTNWDAGQPDNPSCDCVYIWVPEQGGTWDDTYCDASFHFVCEMPAV